MATWRVLIGDELNECGETLADIIHCTLTDDELNVEFDDGYGMPEGKPFTAWTNTRVLFPVVYDGAEWVGSAPRNPCDESSKHNGGY